jgi:hypothetical protein
MVVAIWFVATYYWISSDVMLSVQCWRESKFTCLAPLAHKYLGINASSVTVEAMFSVINNEWSLLISDAANNEQVDLHS